MWWIEALPTTVVLALTVAALVSPHSLDSAADKTNPTANVRNGTYLGTHCSSYNQDFFLGIPFAQAPVRDLRFKRPQPCNETWQGSRNTTEYGDACIQYNGPFSGDYPTSEDCLTLNIVRSSHIRPTDKLPVAVYIHGGGFTTGSGRDQRYNVSFIVKEAENIGKPFIGVTINYRLGTWGVLYSEEVKGSGDANMGLFDQRMALEWLHENIAAFGGDPNQITLWGESAGAASIAYHMTAFGGRDDGLFQAAIMESGNMLVPIIANGTAFFQPLYDDLIKSANCSQHIDTLQCLRDLSFDALQPILNLEIGLLFVPAFDGDFIQQWPSTQLETDAFVKVPILMGTNTDEGTLFAPTGINTTEQLKGYLTSGASETRIPSVIADNVLRLYTNQDGSPEAFDSVPFPALGSEWRRVSSYTGDRMFLSGRRMQAQTWAAAGVPVYTYRWNASPHDGLWYQGVTHGQELALVFLNLGGYGWTDGDPFGNASKAEIDLAYLAADMWISFISDRDPNSGSGSDIYWPLYNGSASSIVPHERIKTANIIGQNFVFDANETSYVEIDDYRWDAIAYLNTLNPLYRR